MFALACSSKSEPPRAEPPPEGTRSEGSGSGDSGDHASAATGDPTAGVRTDRQPAGPGPVRAPAARAARPIDIVLRSSPPGATAAVDGVPIGPTPTYWSGDANGREHEFTFVLPGYAFARYRFVPITSGIVHARLDVLTDDVDAGVPPEMMRTPDGPAPDPRQRTAPPPNAAPTSPNAAPSTGSAAPSAPDADASAPDSKPPPSPAPPSPAPSGTKAAPSAPGGASR